MAPRSHNENREVLCGLCYRKSKDIRKINQNHLLQLQTLVDSRYSLSDARFQTVLCAGCARILAAHTKDPENPERGRKLLKPKYDNLTPPPVHHTRLSVDQFCPCTMCEMARVTIRVGYNVPDSTQMLLEKHWSLLFPDIAYTAPKVGHLSGVCVCVMCICVCVCVRERERE